MDIRLPDIGNIAPSKSNKLNLHKFAQFFDKVLNETNKDNLCTLYSHFISDYYVTIDFSTFKYIVPNHIVSKLNGCKQLKHIQYYIIPIMLKFNENDSHANVLIVDNNTKTIELYEPHGETFMSHTNLIFNIVHHIKKVVQVLLHRRVHFHFKNVHQKCPLGLQAKQDSTVRGGGFCVAWILFFIHVRLLNLQLTSEDIISYFDTLDGTQLDLYIRRYTALVEMESVKHTPKFVQDTYFDLSLTEHETKRAIAMIEHNIDEYITQTESNIKTYGGMQFYDTKALYNSFANFSKFPFFDQVYFKAVDKHFKKKQRQ